MLLTQERSHCFLKNLFTFIYKYNQNAVNMFICYIYRFLDHTHHLSTQMFSRIALSNVIHICPVSVLLFSLQREKYLCFYIPWGFVCLFYILCCVYYEQLLHVRLLHKFRTSVKINNFFLLFQCCCTTTTKSISRKTWVKKRVWVTAAKQLYSPD